MGRQGEMPKGVSTSDKRVGVFDESDYFLGEIALVGATCFRHLGEFSVAENWLGKWAMNQMLINVATRKFARSVRLPEADVPAEPEAEATEADAPVEETTDS